MKNIWLMLSVAVSLGLSLPVLARSSKGGVAVNPNVVNSVRVKNRVANTPAAQVKPRVEMGVVNRLAAQTRSLLNKSFPSLAKKVTDVVNNHHADVAHSVNTTAQAAANGRATEAQVRARMNATGMLSNTSPHSYVTDGLSPVQIARLPKRVQVEALLIKLVVLGGSSLFWPAEPEANYSNVISNIATRYYSLLSKGVNTALAKAQAVNFGLAGIKNVDVIVCKGAGA